MYKSDLISTSKLGIKFFERPTLEVARDLIGKIFIFKNRKLIITETEAYTAQGDEACHAFRGKTKRTEVMFGKAGHLYIYFIYGMYYCMNIVTEKEGVAAAVLIRGGVEITNQNPLSISGPGKLCRAFSIDKNYNKLNIVEHEEIYLIDSKEKYDINITPRIGISKAKDKMWRFVGNSTTYKKL